MLEAVANDDGLIGARKKPHAPTPMRGEVHA